MAAPNTGWAINFIYKQDLRSMYMNQMLYGLVNPGIYNPDIYLKINSVTKLNGASIGIVINKDTSFVFKCSGGNDNSTWLIKATAAGVISGMNTGIYISNSYTNKNNIKEFGRASSQSVRLSYYVFALMHYDTEETISESSNVIHFLGYYRDSTGKYIYVNKEDYTGRTCPYPTDFTEDVGYAMDDSPSKYWSWVMIGKVSPIGGNQDFENISGGTLDVELDKVLDFTGIGADSYKYSHMQNSRPNPSIVTRFSYGSAEGSLKGKTLITGFNVDLNRIYYRNGFITERTSFGDATYFTDGSHHGMNPYSYTVWSYNSLKDKNSWVKSLTGSNWVDIVYGSITRSSGYSYDSDPAKKCPSIKYFQLSYPDIEFKDDYKKCNQERIYNDKDLYYAIIGSITDKKQTASCSPLDMNTSNWSAKSAFFDTYPMIMNYSIDHMINYGLLNSDGPANSESITPENAVGGTDIFPVAIVFRSKSDNGFVDSSDKIIPVLNMVEGNYFNTLHTCKPEFSTVNVIGVDG